MKSPIILFGILCFLVFEAAADLSRYSDKDYDYGNDNARNEYKSNNRLNQKPSSTSKSNNKSFKPSGSVNFDGCNVDPDSGLCCVMKEDKITTLEKDPILECTHKNTEQCHYTYVTQFKPSQEEICEENFEKKCSISFAMRAQNETVEKCYTPLVKVCGGGNGSGRPSGNGGGGSINGIPDILNQYGNEQYKQKRRFKKDIDSNQECKTYYETSCTTKYVEKSPGKFVGDTSCEKLPVEFCGQGCQLEEGEEECHDKTVTSLLDVPEEVCDLNPVKTCRFATRLVPHLSPTHECTIVPQEICQLKFSTPKQVTKPLISKWCLDMSTVVEGRGKAGSQSSANIGEGRKLSQSQKSRQSDRNALDTYKEDEYEDTYTDYEDEYEDDYEYDTSLINYESQQESKLQKSTLEISSTYEIPPSEEPMIMKEVKTAREEYGAPSSSETVGIDENYGAPGQDETTVIIPIRNEYIATDSEVDKISETYGGPQDEYVKETPSNIGGVEKNSEPVLIELQDNYGSPEKKPDEEEEVNISPDTGYGAPTLPDSLYNAPKETDGFGELLGSYGQKSNSVEDDINVNQIAKKPETIYTIDSGFGEEPEYSYTGPDDLAGYQAQTVDRPGLNRHLIPPRPGKGNFVEHNNNKIRSVDPFYRI